MRPIFHNDRECFVIRHPLQSYQPKHIPRKPSGLVLMHELRYALLLCLLVVGCGKKTPPPEEGPGGPIDVVAPSATNYPDDTDLSSKRSPVDLSPFGIRGEILAPNNVAVEITQERVLLTAGKTFAIEVLEAKFTLSQLKEGLKPKAKEYVKDEANTFLVPIETDNGLSYLFVHEVTLGDKKVQLRTPIKTPQTQAQAERALAVAQSLTQTAAIKESMVRETQARAKLQKLNLLPTPRPNGLALSLTGKDVVNEDLADVKDIAGLRTIEIRHATQLTEAAIEQLAGCRGVTKLVLAGPEVQGSILNPVAKFPALDTLIIEEHNLNDANMAAIGSMKGLKHLAFPAGAYPHQWAITAAGISQLKGLKLRSLDLSGLRANEAMLEHLSGMKSLVELNLSYARVGEAGTKSLQGLTNLERLRLNNSAVGDLGLQYLSNMQQLRSLSLHKTLVRGYGLTSLATLGNLRTLTLADTPITDSSLDKLKGLKLTSLDLARTNLTDAGLKYLVTFPDLQELYLDGTRITDAGLVNLTPLTQLTTLELGNTDINGTGLAVLKGCPKLRTLELNDTLVTAESLKELLGCPQLTTLNLADTPITDAGLETLATLKSLREVDLQETEVTPPAVAKLRAADPQRIVFTTEPKPVPEPQPVAAPVAIEQLPPADPSALLTKFGGKMMHEGNDPEKPVRVTLASRDLTDRDVAHLRGIKQLHSLNLNGCAKLTDACLPYLALLPDLEELFLNGTAITGNGLVHLKGLSNLKELELSNAVTIKQAAPLSSLRGLTHLRLKVDGDPDAVLKFFSGFKRLRELDLARLRINNRRLAYLKTLTNLERLEIHSSQLGDRGLDHLKGLTKLRELYLQSDLVTDAGFEHLKELVSLKVLELDTPQLTDKGLAFLAKTPELERLRLLNTRITDRGLQSVRNCSKLRELELPGADIGDVGLRNLENLNDLELVDLRRTKVTDASLKVFQGKAELRKLVLEDTPITGQGFAVLNKLERLYRVYLARSKFNDAGAAALAMIGSLELLDVENTAITDAATTYFKNLPELTTLNVSKNKALTDKALDMLKAIPKLTDLDTRETSLTDKAISELKKREGLKVNE